MPANLATIPLSTIHAAVLATDNDSNAALLLNVHAKTLQEYLQNCRVNDLHLSTQALKKIPQAEGVHRFCPVYHEPLSTALVDIKAYTIAYLHHTCRKESTVTRASKKLFVSTKRLQSHLKQITLDGVALCYDRLRDLSVEQAENLWGVMYHMPLQPGIIDTEPQPEDMIHLRSILISIFQNPADARPSQATTDNHPPNAVPGAGL